MRYGFGGSQVWCRWSGWREDGEDDADGTGRGDGDGDEDDDEENGGLVKKMTRKVSKMTKKMRKMVMRKVGCR